MTRARAVLVLLAGVAAVAWGCVLVGGAVRAAFAPQPLVMLDAAAVASAAGAPVTLTPARGARLVAELDIVTTSVQAAPTGGEPRWHGRYRIPFTYTVTAGAGDVLLREEAAVDWRDDSADMSGRARQSSLSEQHARIAAGGGSVTATAVFRRFEAPADGRVRLRIERGPDTTYDARVADVRYRVEHDLGLHATAVAGGAFALVVGWVAAVVGFVALLPAVPGAAAPGVAVPLLDEAAATRVRWLATACHLAALLGYLLPFGNVAGPLALWLALRSRHPYIDEQGRDAVNFQLTMLAWYLLAFALVLALVGLVLVPLLAVFQLVMTVVAAARAQAGEAWRYPLTVRFVR
ncbi:MAG: DUF4870 domain-containing protein [Gammaproteobacteria bacterium]